MKHVYPWAYAEQAEGGPCVYARLDTPLKKGARVRLGSSGVVGWALCDLDGPTFPRWAFFRFSPRMRKRMWTYWQREGWKESVA